jgi:DNA-binding NtrC family response regulator
VDIRIIAASNKDLRKEIKAETFREDLYSASPSCPSTSPPLRERKEDIAVMLDPSWRPSAPATGGPAMRFSDEALARLAAHPWPGNIRELKNVVERSLRHGHGGSDRCGHPGRIPGQGRPQEADPAPEALPPEFAGLKLAEAKDLFEKG